jgi:acetyl esterase/lipase
MKKNLIIVLRLWMLLFLFYFLDAGILSAQEFIQLWEKGKMPNSKGIEMKDSISNERIFRVGIPGMWTFFSPSSQENKHAAVIICPAGGYQRQAYIISGIQLAKYFNTIGVNAFVLKYRLPNSPDLIQREIAPLQDLQRAIKIVRSNAKTWNIDRDKIGVMGSSSGGHLASTAGTHFEDVSAIGDSLNGISFTPNFLILISPVIDLGKYAHAGSRDNLLGTNAPQKLLENIVLR